MKEHFAGMHTLTSLGYNSFFETRIQEINSEGTFPARVISENKGVYNVKNIHGEFLAKVTGKRMFEAQGREDYPAVGDWVLITELDSEQAIIEHIVPRQTIIKRRFGDKNKSGENNDIQIIATNIDVAFVIESVDRDYSLNRFERYFAILEDGGVQGAIILNKIDLLSDEERENKFKELKDRFPHIDIIMTSTVNDNGLQELKSYIKDGRTYCFLGSSGVGKSSLINKLIGEDVIRTSDVSASSKRGKHTTTRRQMYFLNSGGIVVDNPGIREVGLIDTVEGVDAFFEEIALLGKECKYVDCTHTHEPGCAVTHAIESGKIDREKYENYITLKKEAAYGGMSDSQKRQKNKDFGKFIKKAKEELKDFGYDNYQ
ncbi:MAG TPA: ribosome small subunit-dependent GTPase A [Candidatus Paceibacterota bacterium]|nr:ribosome small subunit-dependent GTPase A [Candidatus Paceibacterota bacterium]